MIGDVLTSSILFEALRLKYPKARLDYLINEHTYAVVENNPNIDHYIFFTEKIEQSKIEFVKLARTIRKKRYNIIIDVYSKLSSNFISQFSGAEKKISYDKKYTRSIYDHNIKRDKKVSNKIGLAIYNRMQLLEPLGIEISPIKPKIYLKEKEISNGKSYLRDKGLKPNSPIYIISLLGSDPSKTYPFDYMAQVIDKIAQSAPNSQLLFNYLPSQVELAVKIYNSCAEATKELVFFDVFGKNLREFLAIAYHCKALIGNEGGAINMAKALNVSTFSIFSPWIDKASWGLFEDDNNKSVHLKDYKPELYTKPEKKFKKESETLYQSFKPELFFDKLEKFLNQIND